MTDHYATLEVSPQARPEVIKAAHRALAKQFSEKNSLLREINQARDILLDDDKRSEFDKSRRKKKRKNSKVGDYKITKEIAAGGFGVTYYAEHSVLGTPVCIKHATNISPLDEKILLDEAKAMWDLRHFGIPAMRDLLQLEDESYALVMSYIPGPTLQEIVDKNGPLDAEHVAWIGERVINILKYLHFHGVVHGDVKPQNIIVQPESHTVVLVDYGLSAVKPSRDTGNKGYTPKFAAPEQIDGKTLVPETDFYGFGVSMIYALGGDIDTMRVPAYTPDSMCKLLKRFIVRDVLSRPNWQEEDIHESWGEAREKDFGRRYSGLKPLKV